MKNILLILLIGLYFCATNYSCKKRYDENKLVVQVYKFKGNNDYSQYVPVELSSDKERITSAPGTITRLPVKLYADYYMNGSMGINSGYLSCTIDEHNSYEIQPGIDSLYKLLIETDPFFEYYQGIGIDELRVDGGIYGIDTSFLNDLIRTNSLEEYFVKLK